MHRDIKLENIMFQNEDSFEPVIVDFGLAENVDIKKYFFYRCGTLGFMAP
jgi:serine/threonine protein kinase